MHRWIGRLYVSAAVLTAIGGLGFILLQGTVGAWAMNIGFGLYGVLMIVAAVHTIRYARARDFRSHRAWALRLLALVIASWLYRMEYSLSALLEPGGRTADFRGWFDLVMNFVFYLPNLLVVELYLRARTPDSSRALRVATCAAIVLSCFVATGGIYTQFWW